MENVPRIASSAVFLRFVKVMKDLGYQVAWRSCYGPDYGLPQHRRRLVLLASRIGTIEIPARTHAADAYITVRDVIGDLPPIEAGASDPSDPLHKARGLSPVNLNRIKASKPGGTWEDWPENLRAPCHRRQSGSSFRNVYARMSWDSPAPTITTLAYNFGAGRFGHPTQDRAISLREAALLQGFSIDHVLTEEGEPMALNRIGRLIGNAVPPVLGFAIGNAIVRHVEAAAGGTLPT
jgi:DNA (cytosine-5)-methyltransferase 1